MHRLERISTILSDLGDVFTFLAPVTCGPLIVAILFSEWGMIIPMAAVPFTFFVMGYLLGQIPHFERGTRLSTSMCSVALFWLACAVVSGIPFMLGLPMNFSDAVFEGMAGWTGTAYTMIPLVDTAPHTLLFWRSFMSWIGGIGFIAFSIALAGSTGLLPSKLFRKESRDEPLMRSIVAVGREIWTIYAMLTFVAVCLILFTGLPLWESVNLGLSAISTGGFCLHQGGISWYNSIFLELILIPIMIAGALPFRLYYAIGRHRRLGFFFGDQQVKVFFIALITGTAVLAYDLIFFSNLETSKAVMQGLFMTVSALTTTGFQTSGLHSWASVTILFLALLAFIGGSSGSTAGGIKLSRIVFSLRALLWWFRRHYTSGRVLMSFRVEGKNIARPTAELEAAKNILVIILSAAVIIAGTLAFSMAYDSVHTFTGALFEAVNAFSNTGFFTGQVTPLMPEFSKWILTCLMWIGRLEVIPVVILAMAVLGRED